MAVNYDNTYWDRIKGFLSEHRVDARWILRGSDDLKPYGSLRIVSHPDLNPGYLRSIFMYVTSVEPKSAIDKVMAIEDFQMEEIELEVYSVNDNINTQIKTYEAPFKELEKLYNVKVFE